MTTSIAGRGTWRDLVLMTSAMAVQIGLMLIAAM